MLNDFFYYIGALVVATAAAWLLLGSIKGIFMEILRAGLRAENVYDRLYALERIAREKKKTNRTQKGGGREDQC